MKIIFINIINGTNHVLALIEFFCFINDNYKDMITLWMILTLTYVIKVNNFTWIFDFRCTRSEIHSQYPLPSLLMRRNEICNNYFIPHELIPLTDFNNKKSKYKLFSANNVIRKRIIYTECLQNLYKKL